MTLSVSPRGRTPRRLLLALLPALAACSVQDSYVSRHAPAALTGLSEPDLESCIGVPDQHATFGHVSIDTYSFSSSSSTSYTIPIVGGLGQSNGGNCKAIFRLEDGHVARVLYSGEKNALLAPDAYCASILRTCTEWLRANPQPRTLPLPPEAKTVPALRIRPGAPASVANAAGDTIAAGTGEKAPRAGDGGVAAFAVGSAPQ